MTDWGWDVALRAYLTVTSQHTPPPYEKSRERHCPILTVVRFGIDYDLG